MSWVVVAVAGGMAAKGAYDGHRQNKIGEADNIARAATIRYSPWTGLGDPGAADYGSGILGGALEGGLQGALAGSSLGGAGGAAGAAGAAQGAQGFALADGSPAPMALNMPNSQQRQGLVMPNNQQGNSPYLQLMNYA